MTTGITRRNALTGAALAGVGIPALAACGGSGGANTATDPATTSTDAAGPLATTGDVPEGSGVVLKDAEVVITQPSAGDFKGFSAICTHQGCLLADVTDTINCGCHGSRFSLADGSPVAGPATAPLPAVELTVTGTDISRA